MKYLDVDWYNFANIIAPSQGRELTFRQRHSYIKNIYLNRFLQCFLCFVFEEVARFRFPAKLNCFLNSSVLSIFLLKTMKTCWDKQTHCVHFRLVNVMFDHHHHHQPHYFYKSTKLQVAMTPYILNDIVFVWMVLDIN